VEGLHASFEKIDDKVRAMIVKGKSDADLACCIEKAWSEQFHTSISMPAVKGMIMHYRAVHGGRKTRKARSQKGGMAPVGWILGQGNTDYTFGRFPVPMSDPQVLKAFSIDRTYDSSVAQSCDKPLVGGGFFDSVMAGHAPHSVPRNFVETGVSAVQAAPIQNPHPSPVSGRVEMAAFAQSAYNPAGISNMSSLAPIYKAA
jgi:hypothetical protein